jgi:TIR domain
VADRRIGAGREIDSTISGYLETANMILLLVSPDFLASDYCYDREMARAMERHESGEARVIPVILHACDWHSTPFGGLVEFRRTGGRSRNGQTGTKHSLMSLGPFGRQALK